MAAEAPGVAVGSVLVEGADPLGLALELLAGGDGLERCITVPYIQKTGLALAGFDECLHPGRILILGESEIRYLGRLERHARTEALRRAFARDLPCVLITGGLAAPPELVVEAERAAVPLLRTPAPTATSIGKLTALLEDRLAPRQLLHGVLMDILGLGVLIIGESGIGKSECALDLVVRGHRLVADDAIEVRRRAEAVLIGTCPGLTRHHMEVRGLGIIDTRALFGVASTRSSKRVELVVQLERWETGREYERLGLEDLHFEILGVRVPLIRMPVAPGRNVAILVEVAARRQLLRARGHHAARRLVRRHERQLRPGASDDDLDTGDAV